MWKQAWTSRRRKIPFSFASLSRHLCARRCAKSVVRPDTPLTMQLDYSILPILTIIYCCSSLDKSNLGNAKTLGMIKDIGSDPDGSVYALLNAFYFISYAPFS